METRSLKFVAEACGAEIRGGVADLGICNVNTDSRTVKTGDLFFAIKGEKFDGHEFVAEVAAKGAAAVVVGRNHIPAQPLNCPLLVVDDVRAALGKLAASYRAEFNLPVVAVGGSNGKTTTKELIASVLRTKFSTLWSEASFNNDIGVPLTLLRLERSHQTAVVEAGTNHPGELAPLVKMIRPQLGVITNIGREHLEFFGDITGVVQEEGALAEQMSPDGKLFINGDDEWTEKIASRTRAQVIRVGLGKPNDWRARRVRLDKSGATFQVERARPGSGTGFQPVSAAAGHNTGRMPVPLNDFAGEYRVNLLGRHQVVNALFAIGVGEELGLSRAEIQRGLAECQPPKMRLNFWEANGIRVLDDCYNANTDSTIAALETLCGLPLQGRRVAVLGDMAELGAQSEAAHAEVGRKSAGLKLDQLFAVGAMAPVMAQAAREAGLVRVMEFADVDGALRAIQSFLKRGDVVLLKASRAARLERLAETLRQE